MKEGWETGGNTVVPGASFSKPQQSQGISLAQCGECKHWANGFCELRKQAVAASAVFASRCNFYEPGKGEKREGPERVAAFIELPPVAEKVKAEKAKPEVAVATAQTAQVAQVPAQVRQAEAEATQAAREPQPAPAQRVEVPLSEGDAQPAPVPQVPQPAKEGVAPGPERRPEITIVLRGRSVFTIPTPEGEVRVEVSGEAARVELNGRVAEGEVRHIAWLCKQVGLTEKSILLVKLYLSEHGLKLLEPPLPQDVLEAVRLAGGREIIGLLRKLSPGDLGLEKLVQAAMELGIISEEEWRRKSLRVLIQRIPVNLRARLINELLEEWGIARIVAYQPRPDVEAEAWCSVLGSRTLYPPDIWTELASKFFSSALTQTVMSYTKKAVRALTREGSVLTWAEVNPFEYFNLGKYVLDLRELQLLPASMVNAWFTYEVDLGLREEDLKEIVERVRRREFEEKENVIYRLWRPLFPSELEWQRWARSWGAVLLPKRMKLISMWKGPSNIGKTSFLSVVTAPIEPVTGAVPLSKLSNPQDRFSNWPLLGKWINAYSEEVEVDARNLSTLKALVGENDWIYVDRKGLPQVKMRSLKAMYFVCNTLPKVRVREPGEMEAFLERLNLVVTPKPAGWQPKEGVEKLVSPVDAFEFLLMQTVLLREEGLPRRTPEETLEILESEHDIFRQFIEEACVLDQHASVEKAVLYSVFTEWCKKKKITEEISYLSFVNSMRRLMNEYGFSEGKGKGGRAVFKGITAAELYSEEQRKQAQLELQRFEEA
jgi:hypothetical protein